MPKDIVVADLRAVDLRAVERHTVEHRVITVVLPVIPVAVLVIPVAQVDSVEIAVDIHAPENIIIKNIIAVWLVSIAVVTDGMDMVTVVVHPVISRYTTSIQSVYNQYVTSM